jgi:hypothetical protein
MLNYTAAYLSKTSVARRKKFLTMTPDRWQIFRCWGCPQIFKMQRHAYITEKGESEKGKGGEKVREREKWEREREIGE